VRDDRAVRVLVSCIPSEGHFSPLLPLARALAGRGHEVTFAVASEWLWRVEEEGFAGLPAGISEQEGRRRVEPERRAIFAAGPEGRRPQLFSLMFARGHAPAKLDELLALARELRPDVVVHDSCDLAAPIAAAALGVPSVNHSFGSVIPAAALAAAAEHVAPLWERAGVEPEPDCGAFRGLFVDLAPASFAWERPWGPAVRLRPAAEAPGRPAPWLDQLERPLVYVTLGTVFPEPRLFRPLLDGLGPAGSALVTVGRGIDPGELGPVPPGVRVESFVPQGHVLDRSAAVVCHGGSGTTLAALSRGLPLVLVPQGADQFDNAARAERAGAAIVLRPGEVTAESVAGALARVLEQPAHREAAGRIAAEIAEMGSAEDVARAVEELAARG
jgi:UDP:flavonoid glycosyltransferase YjiC (YdhE family)